MTLQEETLSLSCVLADAIEQVRPLMLTKQHHFKFRLPDKHVCVKGDKTRLVQVFSNILNNAAKYTPARGQVMLHVAAGDEQIEVEVEDSGVGISPALLPRIFDLFTQAERSPDRAQGGLGLGLALVKKLLELQGGKVSAYSRGLGQGSRFVVCLPRVLSAAGSYHSNESSVLKSPALSTKVLIVDDNQDAAEVLQLVLQAMGHDVVIAHSGEEALAVAYTAPALLFLDIGLPGMDGYELARRLRANLATASSKLIALTGYGQAEDRERARQAGFDHFLVKPVKLTDVLSIFEGNTLVGL